ncbi:MAG: CHASE2 domain-containing protein [Rhizonema sp. NSF051]|nr:CHASE2 domain-containing protein [Rhizonema sp. NSF051]
MLSIIRRIQKETTTRHIGLLPGIAAIAFLILLRISGSLRFLEWAAFDTLMQWRPSESMEERILIVGINEKDINHVHKYPIPDKNLAALLRKLNSYQPAVIGLDIFRDLPVEPGYRELVKSLKETKNLIGVEKVLPDRSDYTINPPPNLPQRQVGFADDIIDTDGKQRRSLLGTSNLQNQWRLSFSLKLAETYLASQKKISLENVKEDLYGMRFNSTEITQIKPDGGSYGQEDAGGTQILINFRNSSQPFHTVSLLDIETGKVQPNLIRNKIVLIGMTSPSIKDYVDVAAIKGENPALIYGVEVQAHVVSQIISAVLDGRSQLHVWAAQWEYLWIVAWGIVGIILGRTIRYPLRMLLSVATASLGLIGICYGLLILGWWVPLVPTVIILVFNSAVFAAFYQHDDALRRRSPPQASRIEERKSVLDQTFDAIHSRPLQTLSIILRKVKGDEELAPQQFLSDLQQFNQELRGVYDFICKEVVYEESSFHLQQEQKLDLVQPLHDILREVYRNVLERELPGFKTIKIKVIDFQPMDEQNLSLKNKQSLCRFLEEALCNVGKHADSTTRLEVTCCQEEGSNIIRVIDDGLGTNVTAKSHSGFGTQQAHSLARQLRGKFKRISNSPKGTICQLTWSANLWLWRF